MIVCITTIIKHFKYVLPHIDDSYLQLLRNHFEVLSIDCQSSPQPQFETASNESHTSDQNVHIHLRSRPGDHTHRNREQLFDDVVRTWCEAGPSLWLERNEKPQDRNNVLDILPIQLIAGGDFKNRATFSELWQHQCKAYGGAEIVFLHDLKLVTIVFYNSDGVLHKIEFRYDQLHEFIVLSFPQDQEESADVFFCLRHVPLLNAATSRVSHYSPEASECSFSEYYLRGYSDDETEAVDGNRGGTGRENEASHGEDSDESSQDENDQEVLLWQPDVLDRLGKHFT